MYQVFEGTRSSKIVMSETGEGATQIMVMAIVISVILLFLAICLLVVIHICIVGRALSGGMNLTNMVERNNEKSSSMSRDDVEKLPCFDFKALEKGTSPVDCAVCLENFKMGDKCRLLPVCRHSFHAQCVDSWLLKTPVCPICRSSADGSDDGGSLGEVGLELSENRTAQVVSSSGYLPESLV